MIPSTRNIDLRAPRVTTWLAEGILGLDASWPRAALGERPPGFGEVSAHAPRDMQARTLLLPNDEAGGLTVLEAETGSGKTEAAAARFLRLFHAGLVDGMTLALPTRTAATQIHERIVRIMARAFPDIGQRPAVVLAVPGYLRFDDAHGKHLAGFEVLWNDDPREQRRHLGWAAEQPKRFLAGTVVVGTVDQVLLSALRVGHAHLRATSLLRHLLVVDEVHASDAYMTRILEEVLSFHLRAGGHALLMSATLGTHVRERLESAARGQRTGSHVPFEKACQAPYPALHHAPRAGAAECHRGEAGLPKEVSVSILAVADDASEIVRQALQAARCGARVIVLRNTVSDAVATQDALEKAIKPADADLLFRVNGLGTPCRRTSSLASHS